MISIHGERPLVATAIHAGHKLRPQVAEWIKLDEKTRLREEDPYTDAWTKAGDLRIVVENSRFQVDMNRKRQRAVYLKPDHAWGLQVWKDNLPRQVVENSLQEYDDFYAEVKNAFTELQNSVGPFVVLDLHSYNHIRPNPDSPPADPEKNPEVIVGTSNMNRRRWAPVVERLISDLQSFDFLGRHLDVRENVKWAGGQFSQWIHNTFPRYGCSFAIEFKKTFMDEWTGELYPERHEAIGRALESAVPGILEELQKFN